jgi:hypothetical protein
LSTVWSDSAILNILVKPAFVQMPLSAVVPLGNDATFSAVATGTLPISFRWRRAGTTFTNGIVVSTPSNSTLIVTNVPLSFDGSGFDVALTNLAGQAVMASSNRAYLTVYAPPAISAQPADQTVLPGTNVTFSVLASGVAPLRYQWRFNQAALPGKTNATLALSNVQLEAEGYYAVVVTNRDGSAISQAALLTVLREVLLRQPQLLSDGSFQFLLEGSLDRRYSIEVATNLADWAVQGTVLCTNGWAPYKDSAATNAPRRFYRARLVP